MAVAGVEIHRYGRLLAGQQGRRRRHRLLGVRIGDVARFWHGGCHRCIAHHMDVRHQRAFQRDRPHRAPAGLIRKSRSPRDAGRELRRDDIHHRPAMPRAELRLDLHAPRMHAHHPAIIRGTHPFHQIRVELGPAIGEQRLFGEAVLGIQRQNLGAWFVALQILRHHGNPFIRPWRTAERVVGDGHDEHAAILHFRQLTRQQGDRLQRRHPAMRHAGTCGLVVAFDGAPAQVDPRRHDQPVIGHVTSVGEAHAAGAGVHGRRCLVHHAHAARG